MRNRKGKIITLVILSCILLAVTGVACAILLAPSPVYEVLQVEIGSGRVSAEQFYKEGKTPELLSDISCIDPDVPGEYELSFRYKKRIYKSVLSVVDTVAPTGTAVEQTIYNDQTLEPADFVTDINDKTEVSVTFGKNPDFAKVGQQTVTVRLTDTSGNVTDVKATLNVIADETFPEFSPMEDLTVNLGQTVSYRKNITATDDRDGQLSFTVDSSSVNLQEAGTYTIAYTATDSSGNTTTAERKIHVSATLTINQELVDEKVQEVLSQIVTEDMNVHQKVKNIYNYVRKHIAYAPSKDDDVLTGAYNAIVKKKGDCFNYFALAKVLLDACGIENMRIDRYQGTSSHVWLLVNAGTGWYHYDVSPQSMQDPFRCFMKTDAQVKAYAQGRSDGRSDYYQFDESLYPERATETYKAS